MAASKPSTRILPRGMRTIGIVTGVTPVAGADYYIQINNKIQSQLPSKYAGFSSKIILYSVNFEEVIEYLHYGRYDLVKGIG